MKRSGMKNLCALTEILFFPAPFRHPGQAKRVERSGKYCGKPDFYFFSEKYLHTRAMQNLLPRFDEITRCFLVNRI